MHFGVGPVRRGAVVALEVVLKDQLPIRMNSIGLPVRDLGMVKVVGTEWLANVLQSAQKIARLWVAVDKDEAHKGDTPNLL